MGEARLLRIAEQVSDGASIDWDEEERRSADSSERRRVRQLRLVASLASAQRKAEASADAASSSLEEASTRIHPAAGPGSAITPTPAPREDPDSATDEPRSWGDLRIEALIGKGSFGKVYRAFDETLHRQVALKLLNRDDPTAERLGAAVLAEGRLLAKLHHENVVAVYGAARHDGRVGLWMEFISGKTLAAILKDQGPSSPKEAALLGIDLCRALAAVHKAGIVHSDVKAWNVMREDGGRIVLMDFGAGRDTSLDSGASDDQRASGTPLYMAPEILAGSPATKLCDLYSLGVLLFHMVTGAYPIEGRSLSELREAHRKGVVKKLLDLRPDLPAEFVQVVETALAHNPAERYASAGAMEAALKAVTGAKVDPAPKPRPDWRLWMLAAAAVVAVGILSYKLSAPGNPPQKNIAGVTEPAPTAAAAPTPPAATKLAVNASLYKRGGFIPKALATGDAVKPGDQIYLELKVGEPLHFYMLNRDDQGEVWVLFPLPDGEIVNPISAGVHHRLPGEVEGEIVNWGVSSAGGRESFLLVASRHPLVDLERTLDTVARAGPQGSIKEEKLTIALLRGVGSLERSEPPLLPNGAPPGLSALLRDLSDRSDDIWMTEIVLENPAK